MSPPLFGLETEYAIMGGQLAPLATRAMAAAPRLLRGLASGDQVFWTAAGGKLYMDPTGFIEYATPEAVHPADAVAAVFAGHDMVARLLASQPGEPQLLLHNTHPDDFHGTSWASHENYAIDRGKFPAIKPALLTHCATRIIFTGAGGFSTDSGCNAFTLSPRAHFLACDISPDTCGLRGIVGARDEHHATRHERVHVIAGETLLSHLGCYLRVSTTAMILSLAQQGLLDCALVAPEQVVAAMQGCALDVTARTHRYRTVGGGTLRAVDTQRFFLEHCDRHRQSLPDWAPEAIAAWDRILTDIERGDPALAGQCDWALRLQVLRQAGAAAGVSLEELADWGKCLRRLAAPWPPFPPEEAGAAAPLSAAEVRHICRQHDKPVERLPVIRRARSRLWAASVQVSVWGRRGIWKQLSNAGALHDDAPGVDARRIEAAWTTPPAGTRAVPRARYIHAHIGGSGVLIDWSCITEIGAKPPRTARFPDPHSTADPVWTEPQRPASTQGRDRQLAAYQLFQEGRFAATIESCRCALANERYARTSWEFNFHRYWSWAAARMGNADDAWRALACAERSAGADPSTLLDDRLVCCRWLGFANGAYAAAAETTLARHQQRPLSGVGSEDIGVLQLRLGRLDEARVHLQRAVDGAEQARLKARAKTSLAEVFRRQGQDAAALRLLAEAEEVQRDRFGVDLAETLVARAKVQREPVVGPSLTRAMSLVLGLNHIPGVVYVLLIGARGANTGATASLLQQRVRAEVERVPALCACSLCARILGDGWNEWISGRNSGADDHYWGLHQ